MTDTKSKALLIEKISPTALTYIKESREENGKHILGRLEGIGAEYNKPTRNGRRYPLELWENVQNSPDFKEGISTNTIFGEADHPEERADTSLKEVAMVLTKYELRKNEGIVWVAFDILDTPNGRILNELLNYGSKIGVSSRGLGDEIVKNGETIIDPETYIFYAFDAVVMPAVASARPAKIESVQSLTESFEREIENATSISELQSMKRIAESVNSPTLVSIIETIDNKLDNRDEDNILSKLENDLGTLAKDNEELKLEVENLKMKSSADDIRLKKLNGLLHNSLKTSSSIGGVLKKTKLEKAKLTNSSLNHSMKLNESVRKLKDADRKALEKIDKMGLENKKLKDIISKKSNAMYKLTVSESKSLAEIDRLLKSENYLKETVSKLNKNIGNVTESKKVCSIDADRLEKSCIELQNTVVGMETVLKSLTESNEKIKSKNLQTMNENRQLKSDVQKIPMLEKDISILEDKLLRVASTKKLNEQKTKSNVETYQKQLENTKKAFSKAVDDYLKIKCATEGVNISTVENLLPKNYTTEDVDKIVLDLADRQRRLNKVPVVVQPRQVVINESADKMSDPDYQTMSILTKRNT